MAMDAKAQRRFQCTYRSTPGGVEWLNLADSETFCKSVVNHSE